MESFLSTDSISKISKIKEETDDDDDLRTFVNQNFDLLDESVLRGLIAAALKDRDENIKQGREASSAEALLGSWGLVIDTVREVTGERQERAGRNFQAIMATAQQGEPKVVAAALTKLYREQQIDRLFLELLNSTLDECRKAGHAEYVGMLGFFQEVIEKNRIVAASLAARAAAAAAPVTPAPAPPAPAPAPASAQPLPLPLPPPTASKEKEKEKEKGKKEEDKTAFPLDAPLTSRVEELDSDDEEDDEDEEDDSDDEDEDEDALVEVPEAGPAAAAAAASTAASAAAGAEEEEEESQEALVRAGEYLTYLLSTYKGDAPSLRDRCQSDLCHRGQLPFSAAALQRVVRDHLQAAQQAGYVNRVQFMRFMLDRVLLPVDDLLARGEAAASGGGQEGALVAGSSAATTYHAPKFVDEQRHGAGGAEVLAPTRFIDGRALHPSSSSSSSADASKAARKGSKSTKKGQRRALTAVSKRVGAHLSAHGWAVCDDFLPTDLVRRVRIEAGLFSEHYEQSEIWVGKQADVGTLLSVPSVRGDKVIWMCGGHKGGAPEGVTRVVKTAGEIEPCRLEAKARAPMRKFAALKELVNSCDRLMDELKLVVPDVNGVYERSDAMLANYPGGGSRFARHVDNTTQDGRRVTMLVYLNPGWTADQGGALRLTPQGDAQGVDVYPECGRLALFYSASMPHEVMPTWGDRHAITLWYYDSGERAEALRRAKEAGRADEAAKAGADAQREAKLFIADLMGGDEVDAQGGEPSKEELAALANKVEDLSLEALGVVASITGAPSSASFREGFRLLVPEDLKQMRQLFRRMGLQD